MQSEELRENHHLVFVGGMHRSGTTLLARLIGSAPEATGLESSGAHMGEGQFLQDVYPQGRKYGGVTRWALDPSSHLTEGDVDNREEAFEGLWSSWSPHWDLNARFLVEKTPLNLTKTTYLQEIFPRSSFIVITRHPVTQALAVRKWAPSRSQRLGLNFRGLVENWVVAHEAFRDDARRLKRLLVVRYEDLIASPATEVERIESFLGLRIPTSRSTLDSSRSRTYENEWARALGQRMDGVAESERGKVKDAIDRLVLPRESRAIGAKFSDRVASLGYQVLNPEIPPREFSMIH